MIDKLSNIVIGKSVLEHAASILTIGFLISSISLTILATEHYQFAPVAGTIAYLLVPAAVPFAIILFLMKLTTSDQISWLRTWALIATIFVAAAISFFKLLDLYGGA